MNKTTGYSINFAGRKIIITRRFGKAASQIGSTEFNTMQQLLRDFAGFDIEYKEIARRENKKSYCGLSIDEMKRFLADKPVELEKLEKVIKIAENKRGKYAIVKKWFLDNFKEEYNAEIDAIRKGDAAEAAAVA